MATLTRRDAASTAQPPCAQHDRRMDTFPCGLGWHGPIYVVGAPNRSDGYGVVAPRPCYAWVLSGAVALSRVPVHSHVWRPAVLLQQPS
jgi:hypothetical protein